MDYQALSTELTTDPENLGYQQHIDSGNINALLDILNADDPTGTTLRRNSIPMGEIYGEVDWTGEWLNLTDVKREGFEQLTSTPTLDASSSNVVAAVEAIFGTSSTTWANLAAIVDRPASRAEVVLKRGATVSHDDVLKALAQ